MFVIRRGDSMDEKTRQLVLDYDQRPAQGGGNLTGVCFPMGKDVEQHGLLGRRTKQRN